MTLDMQEDLVKTRTSLVSILSAGSYSDVKNTLYAEAFTLQLNKEVCLFFWCVIVLDSCLKPVSCMSPL